MAATGALLRCSFTNVVKSDHSRQPPLMTGNGKADQLFRRQGMQDTE